MNDLIDTASQFVHTVLEETTQQRNSCQKWINIGLIIWLFIVSLLALLIVATYEIP